MRSEMGRVRSTQSIAKSTNALGQILEQARDQSVRDCHETACDPNDNIPGFDHLQMISPNMAAWDAIECIDMNRLSQACLSGLLLASVSGFAQPVPAGWHDHE